MVKLTIELEGQEALVRRLEDVDARLSAPLSPLLDVLGQEWASTFQENIRKENLDLPPLAPATHAIRRYYGHGNQPPLVRGGDLLQSIRPLRSGADFVEVGTDLEFAATVQFGGEVTDEKGRKRTVQAFPFIVVEDELVDDTEALIADYFLAPEGP